MYGIIASGQVGSYPSMSSGPVWSSPPAPVLKCIQCNQTLTVNSVYVYGMPGGTQHYCYSCSQFNPFSGFVQSVMPKQNQSSPRLIPLPHPLCSGNLNQDGCCTCESNPPQQQPQKQESWRDRPSLF